MIHLTRLNHHPIAVNCDLVKFIESSPDTTLTLINGEKIIVLEAPTEILTRIGTWRAHILALAWPDGLHAHAAHISAHHHATRAAESE